MPEFLEVMTRTQTSSSWAVAASVAAACAVLTACGSSTGATTPTLTPQAQATTTPALTPTPSAAAASPAASPGAVPSGFAPNSVTFVSLEMGWALGSAHCSSGTCLAVVQTLDGGRTWSAVQAPPTTFAPWPYSTSLASGVSQIRFADPEDGWAYGPDLWSTHDGGLQWTRINLGSVWSLEAAAGAVHAVVLSQLTTTSDLSIESSPTNRDAWSSTGSLAIGAGPIPSTDLVLQGTGGWVIQNDRLVVDGARLASGHWAPWTAPCTTTGGLAALSASSTSSLVAVCQLGVWGGPQPPSVRAYVSANGGASFSVAGVPLPGTANAFSGVAATASPNVIVAGTYTGSQFELVATFNGASSWVTAATVSGPVTYLGFTSPSQGVAISNGSVLWMTYDGGHHWARIDF
jgi:hypothetical protein